MPKPEPVFPGQRLTVEEEYSSGRNTLVDEEGNVVSSSFGKAVFDEDNREVHVDAEGKDLSPLDVGSIILARVTLVKDAVAIMTIAHAEKDGKPRRVGDTSAVLGVARVSRDFIRSMKEHFKVGDFVKAKVSSITPYSIEVSTNEKGLGKVLSREKVVKNILPGKEEFPQPEPKTQVGQEERPRGRMNDRMRSPRGGKW